MQHRFQHILLPVDFSPEDSPILEFALQLAGEETRLSLLHVIETIDTGDDEPDSELQAFYVRMQDHAQAELASLIKRFANGQHPLEPVVRFGKRNREIVRFAEEDGVDLIVMRSHPIDRKHPMESWATVSYQVSVLCSCPVLLVK